VALVGIHHSILSVSDCLSPVVAWDYLRCSVLPADGSITSKGVKFKVTHYPLPKRGQCLGKHAKPDERVQKGGYGKPKTLTESSL
jgi:hypothetical protein